MIHIRKLYIKYFPSQTNHKIFIYNQKNIPVYYMTGSLGWQYSSVEIYNIENNLIAEIKPQHLIGISRFDIFANNQKVSSFYHSLILGKDIGYLSKLKWKISGDSLNFSFTVQKRRSIIMHTSEIFKSSGKTIELQVSHTELEPICLCICAALNYWSLNKPHSFSKIQQRYSKIKYS